MRLPASHRLERMRANRKGDWRMEDVEALCREHDCLCAPSRGGSSHYKVAHPSQAEKLAIPFRRPIKATYIRKLIDFIDAVRRI